MNKTVITAAAAFLLGGLSTGILLAQAQPARPPGAPAEDGSPMARGPRMGPGMGPWMSPGMGPWANRWHEHRAQRMELLRTFALVNRAEDRKLTPPDVRKIAEAFLLWNGNHSWKVLNEKPEGDVIGFDLATADGSVIAHFTMDPKTAHLSRAS